MSDLLTAFADETVQIDDSQKGEILYQAIMSVTPEPDDLPRIVNYIRMKAGSDASFYTRKLAWLPFKTLKLYNSQLLAYTVKVLIQSVIYEDFKDLNAYIRGTLIQNTNPEIFYLHSVLASIKKSIELLTTNDTNKLRVLFDQLEFVCDIFGLSTEKVVECFNEQMRMQASDAFQKPDDKNNDFILAAKDTYWIRTATVMQKNAVAVETFKTIAAGRISTEAFHGKQYVFKDCDSQSLNEMVDVIVHMMSAGITDHNSFSSIMNSLISFYPQFSYEKLFSNKDLTSQFITNIFLILDSKNIDLEKNDIKTLIQLLSKAMSLSVEGADCISHFMQQLSLTATIYLSSSWNQMKGGNELNLSCARFIQNITSAQLDDKTLAFAFILILSRIIDYRIHSYLDKVYEKGFYNSALKDFLNTLSSNQKAKEYLKAYSDYFMNKIITCFLSVKIDKKNDPTRAKSLVDTIDLFADIFSVDKQELLKQISDTVLSVTIGPGNSSGSALSGCDDLEGMDDLTLNQWIVPSYQDFVAPQKTTTKDVNKIASNLYPSLRAKPGNSGSVHD